MAEYFMWESMHQIEDFRCLAYLEHIANPIGITIKDKEKIIHFIDCELKEYNICDLPAYEKNEYIGHIYLSSNEKIVVKFFKNETNSIIIEFAFLNIKNEIYYDNCLCGLLNPINSDNNDIKNCIIKAIIDLKNKYQEMKGIKKQNEKE